MDKLQAGGAALESLVISTQEEEVAAALSNAASFQLLQKHCMDKGATGKQREWAWKILHNLVFGYDAFRTNVFIAQHGVAWVGACLGVLANEIDVPQTTEEKETEQQQGDGDGGGGGGGGAVFYVADVQAVVGARTDEAAAMRDGDAAVHADWRTAMVSLFVVQRILFLALAQHAPARQQLAPAGVIAACSRVLAHSAAYHTLIDAGTVIASGESLRLLHLLLSTHMASSTTSNNNSNDDNDDNDNDNDHVAPPPFPGDTNSTMAPQWTRVGQLVMAMLASCAETTDTWHDWVCDSANLLLLLWTDGLPMLAMPRQQSGVVRLVTALVVTLAQTLHSPVEATPLVAALDRVAEASTAGREVLKQCLLPPPHGTQQLNGSQGALAMIKRHMLSIQVKFCFSLFMFHLCDGDRNVFTHVVGYETAVGFLTDNNMLPPQQQQQKQQ